MFSVKETNLIVIETKIKNQHKAAIIVNEGDGVLIILLSWKESMVLKNICVKRKIKGMNISKRRVKMVMPNVKQNSKLSMGNNSQ